MWIQSDISKYKNQTLFYQRIIQYKILWNSIYFLVEIEVLITKILYFSSINNSKEQYFLTMNKNKFKILSNIQYNAPLKKNSIQSKVRKKNQKPIKPKTNNLHRHINDTSIEYPKSNCGRK